MTGTLTLKRRFLEENAVSANFRSQTLQFFEKHYELLKISIGYFLIAIISDQLDKRKFQSLLSLSALIRILRRFRFFALSLQAT